MILLHELQKVTGCSPEAQFSDTAGTLYGLFLDFKIPLLINPDYAAPANLRSLHCSSRDPRVPTLLGFLCLSRLDQCPIHLLILGIQLHGCTRSQDPEKFAFHLSRTANIGAGTGVLSAWFQKLDRAPGVCL